jgi:hypothetical protein
VHRGVHVVAAQERPDGRLRCECADGQIYEPFDVVVDAGGLSSRSTLSAHAAVGDARKARARGVHSLLLGARRLAYGAVDALDDGAALGARLRDAGAVGALEQLGCYRCTRARRPPTSPTEALDCWRRLLAGASVVLLAATVSSVALGTAWTICWFFELPLIS